MDDSLVNGNMKTIIENAMLSGTVLRVDCVNNHTTTLYPHRVVFIDRQLSLVAEDTIDKTLMQLNFDTIVSVCELHGDEYIPNFGSLEIDDFISGIRAIDGGEIRLILKFHGRESIELTPQLHFIGNPQTVTNPQGEIIWGGSVEPCDDLYEWIISLGNSVEIVDPISLKRDFLAYCERKLEREAA